MSTSSAAEAGAPQDFGARTPWSAGAAIVFTLGALGAAIGAAMLAQPLYPWLGPWMVRPGGGLSQSNAVLASTMLAMIVMQAVMIGVVWWGAGRFGGVRRAVLSLSQPVTVSAFLVGLAGMIALLAPYNLAIYLLWPAEFASDLRPFWDLARSPVLWLAALVVVIGAPLSEELLFRGFLLPALTKTARGFHGAAIVTTLGWTALHLGYSLMGLIEIFLIGLYFSWLMWRYASLWLPIVLHALYNGLQLAVLAMLPGGVS